MSGHSSGSRGVGSWLGTQRIDLEACGSTNDEAARLARAGASHGTIVLAETQHAGRGREGRPWVSPRGAGLYLSAVVRPPLPLAMVPAMTLAIGIGVCDAIRSFGVEAVLKWPNDALVGNRKLAGVLVEAHSQGTRLEAVIVGIGVNLTSSGGGAAGASESLGGELARRAITLEEAAGRPIDREAFLGAVLTSVERWIDRYVAGGLATVIPAWHDRMAKHLLARAATTADGAPLVGEVAGLDGDGALLLRDDAGRLHRVRSGDVEVMRATDVAEPAAATC